MKSINAIEICKAILVQQFQRNRGPADDTVPLGYSKLERAMQFLTMKKMAGASSEKASAPESTWSAAHATGDLYCTVDSRGVGETAPRYQDNEYNGVSHEDVRLPWTSAYH